MKNGEVMSSYELEAIVTDVKYYCDKVRCIVEDVHVYFDKPDGDYPKSDTLECVKYNFNKIEMKLSIVFDLLDRLKDIVRPIELDKDNDVRRVIDS